MKKKFSRILGVGIAVALLTSLMMVATPASAVSSLTVSFAAPQPIGNDNAISTVNPHYIVQFTTGQALTATEAATITVSFPSDTAMNTTSTAPVNFSTIGAATIAATSGWMPGSPGYAPTWVPSNLTSTNWTSVYDPIRGIRTVAYTLNPGDYIGQGATVRIDILAGLVNPSTAGTYSLTVGTSFVVLGTVIPIELPVSASYAISPPMVAPLGGLVQLYNTTNVLMGQWLGSGGITSALTSAAIGPGFTVAVGPGSYTESPTIPANITLKATGTPAATIITGLLTVSSNDTVDSFTINGNVQASGAQSAAIKNCIIGPNLLSPLLYIQPSAMALLAIDSIGQTTPLTLTNDSITLGGTVATKGVSLGSTSGDWVTMIGCTITGVSGTTGIVNSGHLSLIASTLTASGVYTQAVTTATGMAYISGCTFDSWENALVVNSCDFYGVTLTKSTVKNSAKDAIVVNGAGYPVVITGNTITNTAAGTTLAPNYALRVYSAASGNVSVIYNNLTSNTNNVWTDTAFVKVDATHNWWGAATGPAAGSVVGDGTVGSYPLTFIDCRYPLGASVTSMAAVTVNPSGAPITSLILGGALANVDVAESGWSPPPVVMAAAQYTGNPAPVVPPYPALANGYYDVYVSPAANAGTAGTILVKFYNKAVTADTKVYVWSPLDGVWMLCAATTNYALANPSFLPQGINTITGFAYANVAVSGTVPGIPDLVGLSFALVTQKTPPPPATIQQPALGANDVLIKPTFVWTPIAGVIRYEFALSEDSAFKILKWSANVPTNMYAAPEELKYSTTYYWRVRGITAEPYMAGPTWVTPSTDWATGIFTTEAEPAPPAAPAVVPAPKVDVTVQPAQVTVQPSPPVIPDYLLWTIIGVGAVLIIALIVLIVRTRRTA